LACRRSIRGGGSGDRATAESTECRCRRVPRLQSITAGSSMEARQQRSHLTAIPFSSDSHSHLFSSSKLKTSERTRRRQKRPEEQRELYRVTASLTAVYEAISLVTDHYPHLLNEQRCGVHVVKPDVSQDQVHESFMLSWSERRWFPRSA